MLMISGHNEEVQMNKQKEGGRLDTAGWIVSKDVKWGRSGEGQ